MEEDPASLFLLTLASPEPEATHSHKTLSRVEPEEIQNHLAVEQYLCEFVDRGIQYHNKDRFLDGSKH